MYGDSQKGVHAAERNEWWEIGERISGNDEKFERD